MRQSSDMILAAFCYVTAMMIWEIGNRLVYFGATQMWFVVLICTLVVVSGITFQFESLISHYDKCLICFKYFLEQAEGEKVLDEVAGILKHEWNNANNLDRESRDERHNVVLHIRNQLEELRKQGEQR